MYVTVNHAFSLQTTLSELLEKISPYQASLIERNILKKPKKQFWEEKVKKETLPFREQEQMVLQIN